MELVVTGKTAVADGVVSLELADPAGAALPAWEPGAHVDLILGPELERQYSLCGEPADRTRWRIAVLLEAEGRGGSAYVHGRLAVGDRVRVGGPRNHFPLTEAEEYLFVAGGIGVTPLLPMIRQVARAGMPWRLVYGGRSASSMAFAAELTADGAPVELWPQDERGLIDLDGLLATPRPGLHVYCCGPEPLLAAVEERMAAWPPHSLKIERFAPKAGVLGGESTSFTVRLDYSELEVTVGAGQSIVAAVEAAGVEVMTSCREGTCGTCETAVISGIPDHRDSVLSDEEHATNEVMMICCSRSLSPLLVLDL
jgi:ferredoxin-NADP reductase